MQLAEVLAGARRGAPGAIAALYGWFAGDLLRLTGRLLGSSAAAEDVIHDLFVGLPEHLARYDERGRFGAWLRTTIATLDKDEPADVPCGDCNACCRTFHQIHLRPGEKRTRKRLPREYLSVAPGLPPGYLLLGYTETGACPVLFDGRCTIYEDRPLVRRPYDCRMYAATGVTPGQGGHRRPGAALAFQPSLRRRPRPARRLWRPFASSTSGRRACRAIRRAPSRSASPRSRSPCTSCSWRARRSVSAGGPSGTVTVRAPSPTPTRSSSAKADASSGTAFRRDG